MDLAEYKERLIEYASLLNQIPTDASRAAYADFSDEVDRLLDENYEVYIDATIDERKAIRQAIIDNDRDEKDVYEGGPVPAPFRYILNFYIIRTIKELDETGDIVWVWRGLVAISILDGIHYQPDDEEHLARLYVAAEEKGINPNPVFQMISKISNNESTKPEQISTSELIANTHIRAHEIVDELRK